MDPFYTALLLRYLTIPKNTKKGKKPPGAARVLTSQQSLEMMMEKEKKKKEEEEAKERRKREREKKKLRERERRREKLESERHINWKNKISWMNLREERKKNNCNECTICFGEYNLMEYQ